MGLDSFSTGVSASSHHPKGEFFGVIKEVKVENKKDGSGKYFSFDIKTPKGLPPKARLSWVTEQDYSRAEAAANSGDKKLMDSIEMSVKMLKSTLVKLNAFDDKTVSAMPYSACIKALGTLTGKGCRVVVKEQKNNPQFDQTDFLQMPKEDKAVVNQAPASSPSNGFSLDEIPF